MEFRAFHSPVFKDKNLQIIMQESHGEIWGKPLFL
jgi:hypothetical protein